MEHNILSHSILNDTEINKKFQEELKKLTDLIEFEDVFQDVQSMSNICRSQGIRSMISYYDNTSNSFLKDLLYLISVLINKNTDIDYVIYLLKPRFYNYNFIGIDFIKSVLYYEAMLMIVTGEIPELVYVRLISILAKEEKVKDILNGLE